MVKRCCFLALKYISVGIPEKVLEQLKKMKEEGKIASISDYVRHLIYMALEGGFVPQGVRVVRRRTAIVEEEVWEAPAKREERDVIPIYGKHTAELMSQLKLAVQKRREKLNKK